VLTLSTPVANLDDIDRKLLKLLQEDGRAPYAELLFKMRL